MRTIPRASAILKFILEVVFTDGANESTEIRSTVPKLWEKWGKSRGFMSGWSAAMLFFVKK
jgi:hypothetical protein